MKRVIFLFILLAAIALRTGAKVATRNVRHFQAMGCACANPLEDFSGGRENANI